MEYLIQTASTALLFGLRNAVETDGHLMAQHAPPFLMNDEFVGVTKYVVESFHDLLVEETESPSASNSSRRSHHPSHECFMTGTHEGHVKSVSKEEATPVNNLGDEAEGEIAAPPCMRVEQQKARHREIEEARL